MTQGQRWAMTSFAGRCSVPARGGSTAFEETEMGSKQRCSSRQRLVLGAHSETLFGMGLWCF